MLKFNKSLSEVLESEEEVKGLLKIKFKDLGLDDEKDADGKIIRKANKIPNTTVETLFDDLIDENE
jgi:hypothetical protein